MTSPSATAASAPVPPSVPAAHRTGWLLAGAFLVFFWGLLFYHVHTEWLVNTVYSYGFAVPLLAAYLGWERWNTRPHVGARLPYVVVAVLAVAILLTFYPVRLIQEANPDWVKINWSMFGLVSLLTLAGAAAVGGIRWAFHFAFPVLFCFTALPWPVWMEEALVQNLMRGNATICAEVLTFIGMPAIAQGNLIQIADSWVNVEEACSGIRSLQTAFMMGLFLGEFHRFGLFRRGAMLFLALFVAAFGNMIRTIVLAYFSTQGTIDKYHDTVGNIAMIATLVLIYLVGELLRRGTPAKPADTAATPVRPSPASLRPAFPAALSLVGIGLIIGAEVVTQAWYRYHETRVPPAAAWTIEWPKDARGFNQAPFHERSQALLKFNFGENAAWVDSTGYRWQAYFLRWDPGRVSKYLAMSHYPTVCLPATGLTLASETGPWDCRANNVRMPFNTYVFQDASGQDVFVFHAIVEDRPLSDDFRFRYYQVSSTERIASVKRGERNLGQKVIGIAIRGCSSPNEARELVDEALRKMVVNTNPTVATN